VNLINKIEDPKIKEEINNIWSQIEQVCKGIIDGSVSLLHQDPASMVTILLAELNKGHQNISL